MNNVKNKLMLTAFISGLGITTIAPVVQAAEYPNATNGISDVTASITLGETGGPEIPPVDPEEPAPPVDPENPHAGLLSLRYVSDLDFGTIEVATTDLEVIAANDGNGEGAEFENMVTVQDFRNDAQRDGWELTVTQMTEFIPGSNITLSPYIHESKKDALDLETPSSELILNNSAQVFARTTGSGEESNPAGIVSMAMANPDSDGVSLFVPANTATGEYTTTLNWELVSGPFSP